MKAYVNFVLKRTIWVEFHQLIYPHFPLFMLEAGLCQVQHQASKVSKHQWQKSSHWQKQCVRQRCALNCTQCASNVGDSPRRPLNTPGDIWACQKDVCCSGSISSLVHTHRDIAAGGSGHSLHPGFGSEDLSPALPEAHQSGCSAVQIHCCSCRKPLGKNSVNPALFDIQAPAVSHGRIIINF